MKRTTLNWNKRELEEIAALSLVLGAEFGATVKALVRWALDEIGDAEEERREEILSELKDSVSLRRKVVYEKMNKLGLFSE